MYNVRRGIQNSYLNTYLFVGTLPIYKEHKIIIIIATGCFNKFCVFLVIGKTLSTCKNR